jgi:hypothetical protein
VNRILAATALALAICAPVTAHAADYGVGDLRRMHSEYAANEARWANTFTGRTFEGVMPVKDVDAELIGGGYYLTFLEDPSDWMAGVYCDKLPTSQFLMQLNKGDLIQIRGMIDHHSFGAVHLSNCSLSRAPTPAEIEAAQKQHAEAEAEAIAKAKAKADANAKAEIARPQIEQEARDKIEAERAQIEADAKAKVRAQIEADLRAKAELDAKGKAEADAKDEIEAAERAKDAAAAKFKTAEEARLEAEAVAQNEDNVRAAKMAQEASARADKEAAATKTTEDARLEAEAKARHDDNVRDAKAKADAAARAEVGNAIKRKAQFQTLDPSNLASSCNRLNDDMMMRKRQLDSGVPLDSAIPKDLIADDKLSCEVLEERGVPKKMVNGYWHYRP